MANKLTGMLNLSRIPKELIVKNKYGDSVIWIDVIENRVQGKYGETHSVSVYDKNARKAVYLADLKPQEFGQGTQQAAPASANNYRQTPATPAPAPAAPAQPSPADGGDIPF